MNLLKGKVVLDLSHRLPGPLAGKILADMGATVIKVEDEKFKDPFIHGLFAEMDPSFPHWYEELNSNKQILRIDFKDPSSKNKMQELLQTADAIIMGLPPKVREFLGVDQESLQKSGRAISHIELFSKKSLTRGMHDLNAIADIGILKLYVEGKSGDIIDPPFLPVAGITFGHKAATDLIAGMLKASETKKTQFIESFLYEASEEILGPFWPKACREKGISKTLHNGRYPCYSIYKLKDGGYVALAAVEEKFWQRFCESTGLTIESELRFHHQDQSIFKIISSQFLKLTTQDIKKLIEQNDMCLSLI